MNIKALLTVILISTISSSSATLTQIDVENLHNIATNLIATALRLSSAHEKVSFIEKQIEQYKYDMTIDLNEKAQEELAHLIGQLQRTIDDFKTTDEYKEACNPKSPEKRWADYTAARRHKETETNAKREAAGAPSMPDACLTLAELKVTVRNLEQKVLEIDRAIERCTTGTASYVSLRQAKIKLVTDYVKQSKLLAGWKLSKESTFPASFYE